ncbi:MAG: type II toxin-antitoxin system HicA family toxin [Phycisphaerales bacterium]|jgi:predicted RNA binding protein YcfA (HicA-like mRNA interferase family)|nr:type II toxin-antitoxin system HicA family toxin [Phycisphaerales bacterium]MBT7171113.1 type II toxin-antitoxin system HicA family toxin [Phycisphaerales bacterium]
MGKYDKLYERILMGRSDANISFEELCSLLGRLGFEERIRGSHRIFTMTGVEEIINIQAKKSKAKAYQVKQVRNMILQYKLRLGD